MIKSLYRLSKSKKILKEMLRLYRQKGPLLNPEGKQRIEQLIASLQQAILQRNSDAAADMALRLHNESATLMPRTSFDKIKYFIQSIAFALIAALAIRQMWFEFYTIPTGSMRPTLKEGDYLVVSKADYGINTPFRSGHFYFDPALVQRGSIVVWSGENMDIPDDNTMYFYLIPGKKQYIKRLIGKPGDTLYFYGGQIYGVSANGEDLKELRDPIYFQDLEHVPFIRFDGKAEAINTSSQGITSSVVLHQMNQPVAKLSINAIGQVDGTIIPQKGHPQLQNYFDLWGFKNYGMARLLNANQLDQMHPGARVELASAALYLEIHHHPTVLGAQLMRDDMGRIRPGLSRSISLLPLNEEHIAAIMQHMTTSRFIVKDALAGPFGAPTLGTYAPRLAGVPDGTYEFQNGVLTEVIWGNVSREAPSDHPLYRLDLDQIQTLYNMGFEWRSYFNPAPNSPLPSRYVFFRNGDLHTMNGPILKKGDSALTLFLKREYQKQSIATSIRPYHPFDDQGAPLTKDGAIDVEYIKRYGVTVPDKMYLLLGDNHAMSADSRLFGFVPQDNLRGTAGALFWPPGPRFGSLPQAAATLLTFPGLCVWICGVGAVIGTSLWNRRRTFSDAFRNRT